MAAMTGICELGRNFNSSPTTSLHALCMSGKPFVLLQVEFMSNELIA